MHKIIYKINTLEFILINYGDFVILRENKNSFLKVGKLKGDGGLMRKWRNNFYSAHRNK